MNTTNTVLCNAAGKIMQIWMNISKKDLPLPKGIRGRLVELPGDTEPAAGMYVVNGKLHQPPAPEAQEEHINITAQRFIEEEVPIWKQINNITEYLRIKDREDRGLPLAPAQEIKLRRIRRDWKRIDDIREPSNEMTKPKKRPVLNRLTEDKRWKRKQNTR